jgi:hypothetical protein
MQHVQETKNVDCDTGAQTTGNSTTNKKRVVWEPRLKKKSNDKKKKIKKINIWKRQIS